MAAMAVTGFNMAELIEITNAVNEQVCKPIGEKVLAAARSAADAIAVSGEYGNTLRLEIDARTGIKDWAHTRVVSGVTYGMSVESRHGILAKALGS